MVCQTQLGELQERYPEFQDLNAEIITVSRDEVSGVIEMRDLYGAEYVILADPEGDAVKAFGVDDLLDDGLAAPSTFIIGSDGVIRWAYIAQDSADRPTASQILSALVDVTTAIRYTPFKDETLGISFMHPRTWTSVDVGDDEDAPWAILEGEDGVTLQITLEFNAPGADLRPTILRAIESLAGEYGIPSLDELDYFIPDKDTPAFRADLAVHSRGGDSIAVIQAAKRGTATFVLAASGPVAVMEDRQKDINTVFETLTTSVPAPYGIPRDTAFTMPLGEPSTLDPHVARETTSHFYVSSIFSGLVKLDEGLSVVPDLAESWDVDESGTVYTFTIREDITFHNGRPITAADFKYSLERATEPELHSDTAFLYLSDIVGAHEKLEGEACRNLRRRRCRRPHSPHHHRRPQGVFPCQAHLPHQLRGGLGLYRRTGRRVVAGGLAERLRPLHPAQLGRREKS